MKQNEIFGSVMETLIKNGKLDMWCKSALETLYRHIGMLNTMNTINTLTDYSGEYGLFRLLYCGQGIACGMDKEYSKFAIYFIDVNNEVYRNNHTMDYGEIWNTSTMKEIIQVNCNNEVEIYTKKVS